jgi:hypothetical protein
MSQLTFPEAIDEELASVNRQLMRLSIRQLVRAELFRKTRGDGSRQVSLRYKTWFGFSRTLILYLDSTMDSNRTSNRIYVHTRDAIASLKTIFRET